MRSTKLLIIHMLVLKLVDHRSKNCYGETKPRSGIAYSGAHTDQMRIIKELMQGMTNPPTLLDITSLSELRKDGHPSIYSGDLSSEQRSNPLKYADCSHWCLPGLPDAWNELFYASLFAIPPSDDQSHYYYGFAGLSRPNMIIISCIVVAFIFVLHK